MNIFILKDYFRMLRKKDSLEYDHNLFLELEKNQAIPSKYWKGYTELILSVIKKSQLSKFGLSYNLTRGFGEAMAYPWERENSFHKNFAGTSRLRKLIKNDLLYFVLRKLLLDFAQAKTRSKAFNKNASFFKEKKYIEKVTKENSIVVKRLGINRYFKANNKDVTWNIMQSFIYFELIKKTISQNKFKYKLEELISGNTVDIGGGYGGFVDAISIFKYSKNIGSNSINYQIDQFPVTFIANQYLKYRYGKNLISPAYNIKTIKEKLEFLDEQQFRVIQNNTISKIYDLNISFFFNSNSFQEMETFQIEEYAEFIIRNKSSNSVLAFFCYLNQAEVNNSEKVLRTFSKYFKFIGSSEFGYEKVKFGGFVPGIMYLFDPSITKNE